MKRKFPLIFTITLFTFLFTLPVFSEEQSKNLPLPDGYKNIKLGMSLDEAKAALKKESQFGYRGERDVSLMPGQDKILIETDTSRTAPYSYLERCWFQFYEGKLFTIIINIKPSKMDHYSIFSTLCGKYGNPDTLNPEKSEWKDEKVIMSLERPLTLKYVDAEVFQKLLDQSRVYESAEEMSRELFLDSL